MPTNDEVRRKVLDTVAEFARIAPTSVREDHELRKPPISLDDNNTVLLAMSLRAYVKRYKLHATILAKEVKKPGLTVLQLTSLVWERIR